MGLQAQVEHLFSELESERKWLEGQLQAEVVAKTKEQSQLRVELRNQQEEAVRIEVDSKIQMRKELEMELFTLRAAMEAQAASHENMMLEQQKLATTLRDELSAERARYGELKQFVDGLDVEKLRNDAKKYQDLLTSQTVELSSQPSRVHFENATLCKEVTALRKEQS